MKLSLKIVGTREQIVEALKELATEFSRDWFDNNAGTIHTNGAESDYNMTDGKTIEDSPDEKMVRPDELTPMN